MVHRYWVDLALDRHAHVGGHRDQSGLASLP